MSKPNVPDTDRLFDEIAGKLNELSGNKPVESPGERFEKLQAQLKRSQEDWKQAQTNLHERMQNFEQFSNSQNELGQEISRLSKLLEQERANNSRTSGDLAKALELNLKLQFDIEEVRTKAGQLVAEERKHNQFLVEKNRTLAAELELSQAMNQEVRLEFGKAREKFLQDQNNWTEEKNSLQAQLKTQSEEFEAANMRIDEVEDLSRRQVTDIVQKTDELYRQSEEIRALTETLRGFEEHAAMQNESMRQLTSTAERKLVELKLALDKKIIESNDYYGHLQQALTQVNILKQENAALKEYIQKLSQLHQPNAAFGPSSNNGSSASAVNSSSQVSAPVQNSAPTPATHPAPLQTSHPTSLSATVNQPAATLTPPIATAAPAPAPEVAAPVAPSYGSPMTASAAFVPSNQPAPQPQASPAPAWMTTVQVTQPNRPQPPPKPMNPQRADSPQPTQNMAAPANSQTDSTATAVRTGPPPKPRPPFPKAAGNT